MKRVVLLISAFASLMVILTSGRAFSETEKPIRETHKGLNYIKALEGDWIVKTQDGSQYGWNFKITSKGGVVIDHQKIGTPTEMLTIYYLDKGKLRADHFCQLQNQPELLESESEHDLSFACSGDVGGADSHDELHLHGLHYKKNGEDLDILMDMFKEGEVVKTITYKLQRP
jgi:hypothetical protein